VLHYSMKSFMFAGFAGCSTNGHACVLQIAKANMADSATMLAFLSTALQVLNESRCELEDTLGRLAAAAYVDTCDSSSSSSCSDSANPKPTMLQATDGLMPVLALRQGTLSVCEGKSCTRQRGDAVGAMLADHHAPSGEALSVQRCSCMGLCKNAVNVSVECAGAEPLVVSGITVEHLHASLQDAPDVASSGAREPALV
jgi:hypothetical protein